MVNTVRDAPTNMSNAEVQMVHGGSTRHFRAMDLLDTGRVPKHHSHSRTYALFLDEAINGKIVAACHHTVFYKRLLAEFRIAHGPASEGRGILDRLTRH